MGIKYGRGWGGVQISLSQGSVLSREYFPSSCVCVVLQQSLAFCFKIHRLDTKPIAQSLQAYG